MTIRYVRTPTARFLDPRDPARRLRDLLWGDRVEVLGADPSAPGRVRGRARGLEGLVMEGDLGEQRLLELYFIDVGQGDGVLIVTPDGRHLLIDGGFKRAAQPGGKNAADFVDWKFVRDYGRTTIELDAMIASHNDADHYGGLWDLLNVASANELDAQQVKVGRFFTAGVSWFSAPGKKRFLGRETKVGTRKFLLDLLQSRADAERWLAPGPGQRLQGEWADFIRSIVAQGCPIERLSDRSEWLPGFGPEAGGCRIRVLGPVETTVEGQPALRSFGGTSQNTNGNSVLLRLDYGKARVLLTGDLNASAQASLLERYRDTPGELAADVAKACHHASDDCSVEFLRAVAASATVVSSGDAEGFAHPRPAILAASALTGHLRIERDRVVTPLVYSTEVSRSYRLGRITEILDDARQPVADGAKLRARYAEVDPGALRPRIRDRRLVGAQLVSGLIYGLVNVRTDGETLLCATMNEDGRDWDLRTFPARFGGG